LLSDRFALRVNRSGPLAEATQNLVDRWVKTSDWLAVVPRTESAIRFLGLQ
jgi:hypothetical protein